MNCPDSDLANLLCSRLCHDVLNPLGALNNALELLADESDPELRQRYQNLLADSARVATAKLEYYRLAFGAGEGVGEDIATEQIKDLVQGLISGKASTELHWNVPMYSLPKPVAKLLLNLVLIASEALLRGGDLEVAAEARNGHIEIAVRAAGDKVVADSTILSVLSGKTRLNDGQLTARTAAAYLAQTIASKGQGEIQVATQDGILLLGATIKTPV